MKAYIFIIALLVFCQCDIKEDCTAVDEPSVTNCMTVAHDPLVGYCCYITQDSNPQYAKEFCGFLNQESYNNITAFIDYQYQTSGLKLTSVDCHANYLIVALLGLLVLLV